jgi:hypothetical protein
MSTVAEFFAIVTAAQPSALGCVENKADAAVIREQEIVPGASW